MNTNISSKTDGNLGSDHAGLENAVEAVLGTTANHEQANLAQRKLMKRLDERQSESRSSRPMWGLATAAALAVLILPMVIWMPGSNSGLAFAQVQSYFSSFSTMRAELITKVGDMVVMDMRVNVDDHDRARIDVEGQFTLIVDPTLDQLLQLNHMGRTANFTALDQQSQDDPLDWLEDIRQFEGVAERLEQTRLIRNQDAIGFSLDVGGQAMTLWSSEDGQPLQLVIRAAGHESTPDSSLRTEIDFYFDEALDSDRFALSVPDGYRVEHGSED